MYKCWMTRRSMAMETMIDWSLQDISAFANDICRSRFVTATNPSGVNLKQGVQGQKSVLVETSRV